MGLSWRFQASHLLLSRTCALCGASRIVRQHPVTRAQHPRPQAAAVRPSAEAIVCVAGAAARSSNGAQLAGVFTPGSQWVDLRDAKSMAGKYFSQ